LHGVRLAGPGLAVTEQTYIVPVQCRLHELGHFRENGFLAGGGAKDAVKGEAVVLGSVIAGGHLRNL
jgi:hypothetical protein